MIRQIVFRVASTAGRNIIVTFAGMTLLGTALIVFHIVTTGRFTPGQIPGAFLYMWMYWMLLFTLPFTLFSIFSGALIGGVAPFTGTTGSMIMGMGVSIAIAAIGYALWPVIFPGSLLFPIAALLFIAVGAWVGRRTNRLLTGF